MRKLLLGAITILILACSENKENEGMQSASSAIKTRSGTWILEQVRILMFLVSNYSSNVPVKDILVRYIVLC